MLSDPTGAAARSFVEFLPVHRLINNRLYGGAVIFGPILQTAAEVVGIFSSVAGLAQLANHWYKKMPMICKQLPIHYLHHTRRGVLGSSRN